MFKHILRRHFDGRLRSRWAMLGLRHMSSKPNLLHQRPATAQQNAAPVQQNAVPVHKQHNAPLVPLMGYKF